MDLELSIPVSKRRRDWGDDENPSSVQQSSILSFFCRSSKKNRAVPPPRRQSNKRGNDVVGTVPASFDKCQMDSGKVDPVTPDNDQPGATRIKMPQQNGTTNSIAPRQASINTTTKPKKKQKKQQQLYLDFGQRDFGKQIVCQTCGMLYVHGVEEDIKLHERICKDYHEGVSFHPQSCRIVDKATTKKDGGFIVEVRPSDSYAQRQKVKQAMVIVDKELGFAPQSTADAASQDGEKPKTVYLFIRQKHIVGVLSVEMIKQAFPLVQPATDDDSTDDNPQPLQQLARSQTPTHAILGIHKIWVHSTARKQKVASRLMDAARARMVYGTVVSPHMVAFSSPTEAGARFARQYLQRKTAKDPNKISSPPTVLVYDLPL
ncbi:N-acetyltransferase ESCO2 [Seminavis robusta]|uniref:N-acetyltransferase ESCO2 n=1 Tax=Seminavis robusta TaxID=568900 RepID=A0A9N8HV88_9STRA|nr:N-acetyltransferase ESCO2 [Seminavis robusta]|eukprot:Sro1947_g307170.1 N-acetyltransferase ESCO2 (375) ;mRNA; f:13580-14704